MHLGVTLEPEGDRQWQRTGFDGSDTKEVTTVAALGAHLRHASSNSATTSGVTCSFRFPKQLNSDLRKLVAKLEWLEKSSRIRIETVIGFEVKLDKGHAAKNAPVYE